MATLYQTTATTRKVIIGFLFAALIILAVDLAQRAPRATTPITNTNRCYINPDGKDLISAPSIPALEISRQGSSYSLEDFYTTMPDVAFVYQIEKPREKLFVFENAQEIVTNFGFDADVFTDKGDGNFEWVSSDSTKTLSFNKVTQVWNLKTNYEGNIDAIRRKTLSRDLEYYQRQMGRLISNSSWNNYGLDSPTYNIKYAKLDNGIFTEKTAPQESDYVFANAFRTLRFADIKERSELPDTALCKVAKDFDVQVYGSDPRVGQVHAVASDNFNNYARELYELEFTNFEYSAKKVAYSIVTPDEAWNKIQTGQGSLVQLLPQNYNYFADYPTNISVRKFTADRGETMLGYYEPKEWTGYVYPIYVFKGRAELTDGRIASFIFYVDALKR